jgi:hypothetical protein
MNREIDVSNPLSGAIGEFREELLLWIDTELARLREQTDDSVVEEEPKKSQFNGSRSRVGVSQGSPFLQTRIARQEPRTRERAVEHEDLALKNLTPHVPPREPATEPASRLRLSNPRQRLDALARLLDQRLKQAQGTAEKNDGTGTATNIGADDDAPSPAGLEGRR